MRLLKFRTTDTDGQPSIVVLPYANVDSVEQHLAVGETTHHVSVYTTGGASFTFKPGDNGNPAFEALVGKLATESPS